MAKIVSGIVKKNDRTEARVRIRGNRYDVVHFPDGDDWIVQPVETDEDVLRGDGAKQFLGDAVTAKISGDETA